MGDNTKTQDGPTPVETALEELEHAISTAGWDATREDVSLFRKVTFEEACHDLEVTHMIRNYGLACAAEARKSAIVEAVAALGALRDRYGRDVLSAPPGTAIIKAFGYAICEVGALAAKPEPAKGSAP